MRDRIMYIELKSHDGGHDDKGPAWISRVSFSQTGRTVYWRDKALRRAQCISGNHLDEASGDEYWVSGPKRNGQDRYPWTSAKVSIDAEVRVAYWTQIRRQPERVAEAYA